MSWPETDLAYIAGFFDGEGCITTGVHPGGRTALRVQITQKDVSPLLFIKERFEGGYIRPERDCWQLGWSGTKALPFLSAIQPYLIAKQGQARLALEWIALNGGRYPRGKHLPPDVKARRTEIHHELKRLKVVS